MTLIINPETPETISKQPNVEFKGEGVNYVDTANGVLKNENEQKNRQIKKFIPLPPKGRKFSTYYPNIYVNDGSNGSNIKYGYSYKNYNFDNSKPNIQNNYINNYMNNIRRPETYNATDGLKLHPTADHGGYSDYTISYRKK